MRRRAAEVGRTFDQRNRRAGLRGGDGSGPSGRAAAGYDDVVTAQSAISWG
jgi:hypothetical protein